MKHIDKRAKIGEIYEFASKHEQIIAKGIIMASSDTISGGYISPSIRARIITKELQKAGYEIVKKW